MYVAEMTDYPTGPPGGRIRLLEGPRGDGTFERVTIFAADLPFPNSVLPTEGGVLVTAAPDLWLFRDTDGDGVADQKKALLTGFAEGNQQLRVNGLFHGKDGWVYAANGRSSGNLRRPSDPPEKAVSITGHDLRFRLTANAKTFADCAVTAFEPIAGFSQFGLAHDDWGSRFPSWNTVPWRHVVIEDREQERNPYLAPGGGVAEVIPAGDVQLFPASDPPRTFNRESVRSFNASCGPLILRSMGLGEPYLGNAFICEPLLNLVHRRNLRPQGVTFVAERVEQDKEFLASEDPWFHPVFLANGTDGALYVVDFYRRWVEHPAFVPPDQRDKVDWREGYNHGRIWRVRDRSRTVAPFRSVVGNATSDLLARLSYPDGWTRDMAHRLLVARLGSSEVRANQSINLLIDTARRAPSEIGRHHAFWAAFEASRRRDEQLGLDLAVEFLRDPSPRVREQVVSAFGTRLQTDHDSRKALIELAADADPRVRLQAVLALGGSQDSTCLEALLRVLEQDAADPYMRLAVLCGLRDGALSFLNQLASRPAHWFDSDLPARAAVLVQLGEMLGATKSDRELSPVIAIVASQPDKEIRSGRVALLLGLSRGLRRENRSIRAWDRPSPETGVSESPDLRAFLEQLERITASKGDPTRRALGLACLAAARPAVAAGQVGSMLTAEEPELVQDAAARCFGELEDPELAAKVLDRWTSYSIATRSRLLAAMASSRVLAPSLLDAIETKQIHTREFDPATRANLSQFRDSAIRTRVGKLLEVVESDREGIVKRYRV
jgi:putative membrane-bound dehydrogenase-like protein